MEYILMSIFGGGICDWQDIAETEYSWDDIFEQAKYECNTENIENLDINDLYRAVLDLALEELQEEINDYIKNNYSEEEKDIFDKLKQIDCKNLWQWDIWCNSLDTRLTFVGDRELAENLSNCLQQTIDKISDKIGFTEINLNI